MRGDAAYDWAIANCQHNPDGSVVEDSLVELVAGHFAVWVAEQYAAGRHPREINWDTCVRETGLWKDTTGDEPSEVDGDE